MKLKILRKELLEALRFVRPAMSHNLLPVLSCARLSAGDGTLRVETTNMEQRLSIEIDAEVETPGVVVLSVDRLSAVLQCATGAEIGIAVDKKHTATVTSEGRQARILGLAEDEFPPDLDVKGKTRDMDSVPDLGRRLKQLLPAISNDESRYVLLGVYFHERESSLSMVATNGRRLHLVDTGSPAPQGLSAIVPTIGVRALMTLADGGEDVTARFAENVATFTSARRTRVTKLIDGNFPNYRQVIPEDVALAVEVPLAECLEAIAAAAVFAEDTKGVRIESGREGVRLSCKRADVGDASASIAAPQKREVTITLDHEYLTQATSAAGGASLRIEMTRDGLSPVVIREDGFLAVVMPMRTAA